MVRNSGDSRMETTFYEDLGYRGGGDVSRLKQNLTLNLNQGPAKKTRAALGTPAPVLTTPDVSMFVMATPDVEKFIRENALSSVEPTPALFPRHVTEEQEIYAQGFVKALNELHHSDSSSQGGLQPVEASRTPAAPTYMSLDTQFEPQTKNFVFGADGPVVVKDEPQTVPSIASSPPVSPIDMENQERIKLERKRQRNRLAASKCRKKKIERIAKLEEKVKTLKTENAELTVVMKKLKDQVCELKQQVLDHHHNGCAIMNPSTHFVA